MNPSRRMALQRKTRLLRLVGLVLWLAATVAPLWLARTSATLGPWPLDFWMAAQGSVLAYLLILGAYAGLVNRWERQAGELSFEPPPAQDV